MSLPPKTQAQTADGIVTRRKDGPALAATRVKKTAKSSVVVWQRPRTLPVTPHAPDAPDTLRIAEHDEPY